METPLVRQRFNNITRRVRPNGTTTNRIRIRRKGAPEFSTQLESMQQALAKRDEQLGRMRQMQLGGIVPDITVREAIASYRESSRFKNLANPVTVNTGLNYWDDRLKTTRLVDLSGPRLARERNRLEKLKKTGATVCAYLSALSVAWAHAHEELGAVPNGVTGIRWPRLIVSHRRSSHRSKCAICSSAPMSTQPGRLWVSLFGCR